MEQDFTLAIFFPLILVLFGSAFWRDLVLNHRNPLAQRLSHFGGQSREETAIWPRSFAIIRDQTGRYREGREAIAPQGSPKLQFLINSKQLDLGLAAP